MECSSVCRRHKRCRFYPWVGNIPWRRKWQPTPVFLPGESPWTEEPGGLQSMGPQRVGHDWACDQSQKWRRTLRFLPPLEMRPSSIAPNPVEPREGPPILSHKQKNEIIPSVATWMDLETIILSKSGRQRQMLWYHLHVESKIRKIQMNFSTKQKQTHRLREWIYDYQGGM